MTKVDEGNLNNIHTSSNHKVNWFGKSMIFGNVVIFESGCYECHVCSYVNVYMNWRQWDDIW